MTRKEAKELTLELWQYLAEHPECFLKSQVEEGLWLKIKGLLNRCPLCKLFQNLICEGCPLMNGIHNCEEWPSPWNRWLYSDDDSTRKKAAERIVEIVSAWEPEQ
jgi:hypothetical protein